MTLYLLLSLGSQIGIQFIRFDATKSKKSRYLCLVWNVHRLLELGVWNQPQIKENFICECIMTTPFPPSFPKFEGVPTYLLFHFIKDVLLDVGAIL